MDILDLFQDGEIYLESFDRFIQLRPGQMFIDLGTVPNLKEQARLLISDFGEPYFGRIPIAAGEKDVGYCDLFIPEHGLYACAAYYSEELEGPEFEGWVLPLVQAHETSHMLQLFGLSHVVYEELHKQGFRPDPNKLRNDEIFAESGGIAAVKKRGFELGYEDLFNHNQEKALRLLNESRYDVF